MNIPAAYTAFVTGSTGIVGAHVLFELLQRGARVKALRRTSSNVEMVRRVFGYYSGQADALFDRIEWVYGDLEHAESLYDALEDVHHVYHCAALVSLDPADDEAMRRANVDGTAHLITQCRKANIGKFCFVSSSAALGKPASGEGLVDENTPFQVTYDLSGYARSKYESEQVVWQAIAEGLNAVIVNPVVIIGPGDWERSSARLIPQIWKGFPAYTTGVTGFVDARDVGRAMIALMQSDIQGERFVLCAESCSFQHTFNLIADALGKRRPFIRAPKWLGELSWRFSALFSYITGKPAAVTRVSVSSAYCRYYFSNEKIRRAIGYEFIPLGESVRHACACFLKDMK